jgi:hypothetical protein
MQNEIILAVQDTSNLLTYENAFYFETKTVELMLFYGGTAMNY